MIKFGFEREFFVVNSKKEYVLCPAGVPFDACGYLAEARSEPHSDPLKAAYLLLAEEDRMRGLMPRGFKLKLVDTIELNPELLRSALRQHGKAPNPAQRGSLYKLDYKPDDKFCRAGLHVHFSKTHDFENKDGHKLSIPQIMNMPAIIQRLDDAFADEIKEANRLPGLYEMKAHGFEYRSLPASIDILEVADVLTDEVRGLI